MRASKNGSPWRLQKALVFLLVFPVLFLALNTTVAAQTGSSGNTMTFRQARKLVLASLTSMYLCPVIHQEPLQNVQVDHSALRFSGKISKWRVGEEGSFSLGFEDIKDISVTKSNMSYLFSTDDDEACGKEAFYRVRIELVSRKPAHYLYTWWKAERNANQFADALRWLTSHASELSADQSGAEGFKQKAADWRAMAEKPTMPENARQHKVLAENAVQEKNFDEAIDEYEAALNIFPTWPEGQFNVALLCGETGDYEEAVQHMKNYLELYPNAPDAQAAQDRLIIWQHKIGK